MNEEAWVDAALGINMLLGLWVVFSPFLLSFRGVLPAVWNCLGVGLLVSFFSGIRISVGYTQPLWSWCTALLSLWLMVSPFALGFTKISTATWNDLCVGAVMLFLSWKAGVSPGAEKGLEPGTSPNQTNRHSAVS